MMRNIFIGICLLGCYSSFSQQLSYSDPATAYLRVMLEKGGEGMVQQVGNFKVQGTSYLFGPKLTGNVFTGKEQGLNVQLSYNTYNQQLEIYQNGQEKPLRKNVEEVDSFRLLSSSLTDYKQDLYFVNSLILDSSAKKFFVQQVTTGKRFTLYKAYKSVMGYVSSNYVQSDLRQFELLYDYYYTDANKPGLKKLKVNSNNLKKEFKDIADISSFVNSDEFTTNPENALIKVFSAINVK